MVTDNQMPTVQFRQRATLFAQLSLLGLIMLRPLTCTTAMHNQDMIVGI
jgi:hypothetical protein